MLSYVALRMKKKPALPKADCKMLRKGCFKKRILFLILTTSNLNKMDHFFIFAFIYFEAKHAGKSVLLMNRGIFLLYLHPIIIL